MDELHLELFEKKGKTFMAELHLELSDLEVETLDFGHQDTSESSLASVMTGQGMTEIGASVFVGPCICSGSLCCSCCPICCCCCIIDGP